MNVARVSPTLTRTDRKMGMNRFRELEVLCGAGERRRHSEDGDDERLMMKVPRRGS